MKSYNILKVIFLLPINEKMTIKTLAQELEVSQRTVKRYIADIMCLDLPINAIQGKNGGMYFDKDEFYKKFEVTAKEIDYIIDTFYTNKSLEFLFKSNYIDFSDVLRKIKVNNIIEVDFSKWFNNMEVSKEVIAKVYEDFESNEIEEKNNLLIVTSTRMNNPSLLTLVLSYGRYAKVISPKEIIVQILDNVNTVKKIYKGDSVCLVDGL